MIGYYAVPKRLRVSFRDFAIPDDLKVRRSGLGFYATREDALRLFLLLEEAHPALIEKRRAGRRLLAAKRK